MLFVDEDARRLCLPPLIVLLRLKSCSLFVIGGNKSEFEASDLTEYIPWFEFYYCDLLCCPNVSLTSFIASAPASLPLSYCSIKWCWGGAAPNPTPSVMPPTLLFETSTDAKCSFRTPPVVVLSFYLVLVVSPLTFTALYRA